jgi:hypothetical protein
MRRRLLARVADPRNLRTVPNMAAPLLHKSGQDYTGVVNVSSKISA